jgi:hypothetical protein
MSEGEPGQREHYGPNYYAAYVRDPDGNNLQAVCYALDSMIAAQGGRDGALQSRQVF